MRGVVGGALRTRVCHLTSVHNFNDNRIFYKECQTLSSIGFDVHLVAPCDRDRIQNSITVWSIQKPSSRIKRIFYTSFFQILKKAIQSKSKIFHFHDPEIIPAALILSLLGKKVIYDAHEDASAALLTREYIKASWLRRAISKSVGYVERFSIQFFSAIVCARPDIAEKFKRKDVYVIKNYPALKEITKSKSESLQKKDNSKFVVIYVGAMTRIRGIFELVESFKHLDNHELWLLGKFTETGLKEQCEKSEGWKNTKYLGSVSPSEVFTHISKADIGIVPFLPAPNHLRTIATKPFEYMSCELPMVLPDFEYWKNIYDEAGLYADTTDPGAIAKSISEMTSSWPKWKKQGEINAQHIESKFNWENESKELMKVYKSITGGTLPQETLKRPTPLTRANKIIKNIKKRRPPSGNQRESVSIYTLQGLGNTINGVRAILPISRKHNITVHTMKSGAKFLGETLKCKVHPYSSRISILEESKKASDFALSLYPNWKREISGLWRDPSPQKMCFSKSKSPYTQLNPFHKITVDPEVHDIDNNYDLLEALDVEFDLNEDFFKSFTGNTATIQNKASIHPTASSLNKLYPVSFWTKLLNLLEKEEYEDIQIFCDDSPEEISYCRKIIDSSTQSNINLYSGRSFNTLVHEIGTSQLFLGVDSSLAHLAALLKTHSVVLWGFADYRRIFPYSTRSKIYLPNESRTQKHSAYSRKALAHYNRANPEDIISIINDKITPSFMHTSSRIGNIPFYEY